MCYICEMLGRVGKNYTKTQAVIRGARHMYVPGLDWSQLPSKRTWNAKAEKKALLKREG